MSANEPTNPDEPNSAGRTDEPDSPERAREPSTALRVGLAALGVLVMLYSILIATRPLLGVTFVVWLFGIYLLWRFFHLASRFVRAVERIADAMEGSDPP